MKAWQGVESEKKGEREIEREQERSWRREKLTANLNGQKKKERKAKVSSLAFYSHSLSPYLSDAGEEIYIP